MLKTKVEIDHQLAASIIDHLGFSLQDLSLDYGDVVIPSGDISHQLFYGSTYSDINLLGYIWVENGVYYVANGGNHRSADQAALDLLPVDLVQDAATRILLERSTIPDYD